MSRRSGLALALALLAAAGPSVVTGATALRVRVSPDLASSFRQALTSRGLTAIVEEGDPASTVGADLVVGRLEHLTRALESGRANEEVMVDLSVDVRGARGPSRLVAVAVSDSPRTSEVRALVRALSVERARDVFAHGTGTITPQELAAELGAPPSGLARYATAVADWWVPVCSLSSNEYNDPNQVLQAPNGTRTAGKDEYSGIFSLGQGGWVVVDMGQTVNNAPGPDVRVYQTTGTEPVTVYVGDAPTGPWQAIGFRRSCGNRIAGLPNSMGTCDFDLAEGGRASARYLKIEDGELFPCIRRGTVTEGADIDAVELLNP